MKPCVLFALAVFTLLTFFPSAISAGEARGNWGIHGSPKIPIETILAEISADSIRSYIQNLQNFHTRHTNSDTLSDTSGIGAARRWVFKKFQEFSQLSGGRLIPEYFDFTATIQGVSRLNRNVLARLPGTLPESKDRIFLVSGHLDDRTVDGTNFTSFAPGANDDGSGTAVSIELARVMSKYAFECTLIFMTVVGEDEGLFGSDAYAKWARSSNLRIDGMITNDVVGNIIGENGITDSMSVRHFSSLAESTPHRQMARSMKLKSESIMSEFTLRLIPDVDRPGRGGDHQSFQAQGYTAVRFVEPNENLANQHSPNDLLANMSPAYTARVARVNAIGLAMLANAPASPIGLQVLNPGNGTSLIAKWQHTNIEPDTAGYRVAIRDSGSLTYARIIDVGKSTEDTIAGLTPGAPVYISLSAYDTSGYESIFSNEILMRPAVVPAQLKNVQAISKPTGISLRWNPSPELDVTRYRIYRGMSPTSGFQPYDSVSVPASLWDDTHAQPHTMYYYQITAVDQDQNQSVLSGIVRGQLATHDLGILLVDGTKDGTGSALSPSNKQIDDYYAWLTSNFKVTAQWDIAESLRINSLNRITDADMGVFSTMVWHSDVRNSSPIAAESTQIKKFLDNGGNLIISGWKLSSSLLGVDLTSSTFSPGSFVPMYLKIPSFQSAGPSDRDFRAANSLLGDYPTIEMDSVKLPNFGGTLTNMDIITTPLLGEPTTQAIYTYVSPSGSTSPRHGKPISIRYLGNDFKVIIFDFPLYYMKLPEAKKIMVRALLDVGELQVTRLGNGERNQMPAAFSLEQNYPNPFNPSTTIRFGVPVRSHVKLEVVNALGQRVTVLVSRILDAGYYEVDWHSALPSGIYFCRIEASPLADPAGQYFNTRKMLMLK